MNTEVMDRQRALRRALSFVSVIAFPFVVVTAILHQTIPFIFLRYLWTRVGCMVHEHRLMKIEDSEWFTVLQRSTKCLFTSFSTD
jgi:hypothetical protein